AVIEFADQDSESSIKDQVLLLKGNKALSTGDVHGAAELFEKYRERQCAVLGGGDAEKGLAELKSKFALASRLDKEGKLDEAQKAAEGIPGPLLLAHGFLENYEKKKLRKANLLLLSAMREEVAADAK